ncbi:PTS sugar transporter subunit IIA [Brachyspira sp.]|uniref:PTS sugar transporter subunit IIA n=1 Tax=Brachyspira sp. TaxID=1977261 RepID=UPI0026150B7C|nr:PTS sugar transporter subunit IIA [Brachyspira sp.]
MNAAIEEELVDELVKYLVPAIYRIKNNFCIDDKLDFNNIKIDIFNKVKSSVNNNISYLQEPLRDEEIYYISRIIEKYTYPNNKISLKELVRIIDKNYYDKGILIEKIRKKFAGFIDNDINNAFDYKISKILKKKNIYIIKKSSNIEYILNIVFNKKYISNFKNTINKFGKYFFIKENIFLFSNMYTSINDTENSSCIYLIILDKPILIDNQKASILFFISTNNKTEHLHIVSQIMKLSEYNFLLEEIKKQKNSDKIISLIKKYYHN